MTIYRRGVTELPPVAVAAEEVFGFEVRVDISRHTTARTRLRVEVFASPDGQRWEIAGRDEALSDVNPRDQFNQPRQFWSFGTGVYWARVERGMLVGWRGRWTHPQYKVVITAGGGDVEADVQVTPVTQAPAIKEPFPFHRSVHFIKMVTAHDEGGTGATTANISTTTGNALKCFVSYYSGYVSFTDSASHTWSDIGEQTATMPYHSRIFYAKNITGNASHNFTFSHDSGGYANFVVVETFDEHLTAPLDQVAHNSSGAAVTGTLAQAKQIVFGMCSADASGLGYTTPAGYFELFNESNASHLGCLVAYKVVNSTSAVTWDPGLTGANPVRSVATFKETATPAVIPAKPTGATGYTTTKAWTANTEAHYLMMETGSPTSQGAADISGNARHLVAFKEGPHDYPGMIDGVIGPGRVFTGDNDDVNALVLESNDLAFVGPMSASWVWENAGQTFLGGVNDPCILGVAASGSNNCWNAFYQELQDKITWFDGAAAYDVISNKNFNPLEPITYRMMVTRAGAGSGDTVRFYYQALNGDAMVKDYDSPGGADADGTPAWFAIGCSLWNGAPRNYVQGIKIAVYEVRVWDVELSEATVAAYFADPYGEFVASGTTVTVTGVAATGALGSVTITAGAGVTVSVTGVQSAGAIGSVTARVNVTAAVTGVQAPGTLGSVIARANVRATVTGVAAAGAIGTVSIVAGGSITVIATGVSCAVQLGNEAVVFAASVTLTGVAAAGAVGAVNASAAVNVTVSVTGLEVAGAVGSISTVGGIVVRVTGVSASAETTSAGLVFDATVLALGVSAQGRVGTVKLTGIDSTVEFESMLFSALAHLVAGRMYPNTFPQPFVLPQWPAIRYTIVSEAPASDLCGDDVLNTSDSRVQFDIVADRYGEVREVRHALLTQFQSFPIPNLYDNEINTYDSETKTHRCAVDVVFYPSSDPG